MRETGTVRRDVGRIQIVSDLHLERYGHEPPDDGSFEPDETRDLGSTGWHISQDSQHTQGRRKREVQARRCYSPNRGRNVKCATGKSGVIKRKDTQG